MQLLNDQSRGGSAAVELLVSLAIIAAVATGVYVIQHPHTPPTAQISAALQQ